MPRTHLNTVLLAEALRHHRQGRALLLDDDYAKSKALECRGTDQQRLLCWVSNTAASEGLRSSIDALKKAANWAVLVILVAALLAGAAAAAAVLDTAAGRVVEIPFALLSLAGVQLLFLALWLVFAVWTLSRRRLGASNVPPTRLVASLTLWVARFLARFAQSRTSSREDRRAAAIALTELPGRDAVGWWLFSTVTHLAWLVFTLGALLVCWVRLIAVQYDFVWGTTILSEEAAASALLAVARWPGLLGFAVPDVQLLDAARLGETVAGVGRDVWGAFLLGSLIAYGVVPRFVLALACGLQAWRLAGRAKLEQGHVMFQEALIVLDRARGAGDPLGPEPGDVLKRPRAVPPQTRFGAGEFFVLIGLELDAGDAWPPKSDHWHCLALRHVATRADAKQVLSELQRLTEAPRFVAVVASMARTPDRGAMDLLSEVSQAARAPLLLILAESALLDERGLDAAQREREWRERAARVGIGAVVVADWDRLAALRQEALEDSLRRAGVG